MSTLQVLSAQTEPTQFGFNRGAGDSTVYGLAGNDTITFEGVNDASSLGTVVRLGEGDDTVTPGPQPQRWKQRAYAGAGATHH